MNEIEQLIDEVGANDFRPLTADNQERYEESSVFDYDEDADTTISLQQAKRLADAAEGQVSSTRFDSDEEFFETLERITNDWLPAELRFAGCLGEYGYLDAVYVVYEDIQNEPLKHKFKKYCVLHFKHWMQGGPEDNGGICPLCDDRINFSHEEFRNDDKLWAKPDEFDFREYPHFGKCVRMWWDD